MRRIQLQTGAHVWHGFWSTGKVAYCEVLKT